VPPLSLATRPVERMLSKDDGGAERELGLLDPQRYGSPLHCSEVLSRHGGHG
jgi:hypothetical protein